MSMDKDDMIRDSMCDDLWRDQVLPKFRQSGMSTPQIDVARKMFRAGFEAGWDSHQAHLTKQFIAESQKQKVHLA